MAGSADNDVERSGRGRRELAELSALADGRLDGARQAEVRARIADSVELSALYERERRVVDLIREAQATTRAPVALRARVDAERGRARRVRLRPAYGGALVAGLVAIVLALVLVLPAGTPGAPSVSQAAALALRGSVAPAPGADPGDPAGRLGRGVGRVYFPNWASTLGWRAVGQRVDRLDGRLAVTVYYEWRGRQVAYTVVGAPALSQPQAVISRVEGTELRTLRLDGRLVVTWRRAGDSCVLSGADVSASELQQLAAWTPVGVH
jgi:hypothetical protein